VSHDPHGVSHDPHGVSHDPPTDGMLGFRHVGDRLVHQGYIWHVVVGTFVSPSGETFSRDIVRSPGAVAAVPLLFDAEGTPSVVLVRQYRPAYDDYVIEIPAGMRDIEGEPIADTIARELVEEVGLRAGKLEPLLEFYPSAGMTDSVLHLYLATALVATARDVHGPEEEDMQVLHLPLAVAVEMVLRGEIHDAKTIVGLLLVDRRLREGDQQ
jgi:nudix-type nucleoside diphosphatase (YffH/AdpP family)